MMYIAYVLLPKDTEDVEYKVMALMAPYSEDLEVEEYARPCECIRHKVRDSVKRPADAKFGEPKGLWEKLTEQKDPEEAATIWDDILFDYKRFVNSHYESLCEAISPDPNCMECNGSGLEISTFNQISQWDGWEFDHASQVIEDAADDALMGKTNEEVPRLFDLGQGPAKIYDLSEIDTATIEVPYAILSPDGWQGCTERTKIGLVNLPDSIWIEKARKILQKFKDHLLIPVECHV
jgi:hypothetical protein